MPQVTRRLRRIVKLVPDHAAEALDFTKGLRHIGRQLVRVEELQLRFRQDRPEGVGDIMPEFTQRIG